MKPFAEPRAGLIVRPTRLCFTGTHDTQVIPANIVAFYEPVVAGEGQFSHYRETASPTVVVFQQDAKIIATPGTYTNALFAIPRASVVAEEDLGYVSKLSVFVYHAINSSEYHVAKVSNSSTLDPAVAATLARLGMPGFGSPPVDAPIIDHVDAIESVTLYASVAPIRPLPQIGYDGEHPSMEPRSVAVNPSYAMGMASLRQYMLAAQISPTAYVMSGAGTIIALPLALISHVDIVSPAAFSDLTLWNDQQQPEIGMRYTIRPEWHANPVIAVASDVPSTVSAFVGGAYPASGRPQREIVPLYVDITAIGRMETVQRRLADPMWVSHVSRLTKADIEVVRNGYTKYVPKTEPA